GLERHDNPSGVGQLTFVDRRAPQTRKELPGTVRLLLADDFLRDELQTLFFSLVQRRQRPGSDGEKRKPHVQPTPLWAWIRGIGRIGKDLRGEQLVLIAKQRFKRSRDELVVDRISLPPGFAQRPKRHRHMMARGALASV